MSEQNFDTVFPGFSCLGLLDEDAFGKVYLAEKTENGKSEYAAVKVVPVPAGDDAVQSALSLGISEDLLKLYFDRFKNDLNWELTMFRSISSSAIAPCDEAVFTDNEDGLGWIGYIRTKLYTPLSVYFRKKKVSADEAVRLGLGVLSAIEILGNYGMVHGGICPENIKVDDSGNYVLTNFGIRRCLKKAGSNLFYGLTEKYDAPETKNGGRYTNASDIYSLGMTLLELTKDEEGNVPPSLAEIIETATAEKPEQRYHGAFEMKAALMKIAPEISDIRRADAVAYALGKIGTSVSTKPTEKQKTATVAPEKMPAPEKKTEPVSAPAEAEEPEKKSGGRGIITAIAVCAVIAVALFTIKPWNLIKKPVTDPVDDPSVVDPVPDDPVDPVDTPDTPDNPDDQGNTTEEPTDVPDDPNGNTDEPIDEPIDEPVSDPEPVKPDDSQAPDGYVRKTEATENEYIFNGDTEEITREQLKKMDRNETFIALDELYARHGMIFENEYVQKVFEKQLWYSPKTYDMNVAFEEFNEMELLNHQIIVDYQREKRYRK